MRSFVRNYYQNANSIEGIKDPFHEVLLLSSDLDFTFEELKAKADNFPRSWFELISLSTKEKKEFLFEYWLDTLHPSFEFLQELDIFFSSLEDIGIFLVKEFVSSPYLVELVYSLEKKNLFFVGLPPRMTPFSAEAELFSFFPDDYLSFLKIHNGFRRFDEKGIIPLEQLKEYSYRFQKCYTESLKKIPLGQRVDDPKVFFPFSRDKNGGVSCFHLGFNNSIGKVCYINNHCHLKTDPMVGFERTFDSFTHWLCHYLRY
jgi:hypothetical protein